MENSATNTNSLKQQNALLMKTNRQLREQVEMLEELLTKQKDHNDHLWALLGHFEDQNRALEAELTAIS